MKPNTSVLKVARVLSWIIATVLVLLPFHAFMTTWLGSSVGHFDVIHVWKEIILITLLPPAIWLAYKTPHLKQWLLKSWIFRLIIIYALITLVLGWWAYSHQQVDKSALLYSFVINLRFFYFFCLCVAVSSIDNFLRIHWAKIIAIPGIIVVAFGLLQKAILPSDFLKHFGYGPKTIPTYQTVDANLDYARLQSTLRGANPLGAYLILLIPTLVVKLRRRIYLLLISLAASFAVLFYTYSRSAMVGTLIALASFGWLFMRRPTAKWLISGLIVLLLISGLYLGFRSNQTVQNIFLHTSNSSRSAASSNQIRNDALRNATQDIINQPLGRGPGTAGPASFRNNHPARIAEDYYLQIGQEVGVAGLILFLSIIVLVGYNLWQQRSDNLAKVLLASLIGISFVNIVSHAWTDDTLSLIWWGLAGIALARPFVKTKH